MSAPRHVLAAMAIAAAALATDPPPAQAHAFGQRYDLPLPLGYFIAGAGAAVVLSFAVVAILFRHAGHGSRLEMTLIRELRPAWLRAARGALGGLGVALLVTIIAAGLFGAPQASANPAPVLVWVLWWVGLLLLCAFVGNLWPALDPWSAAWRAARWLGRTYLHPLPSTAGAAAAPWPTRPPPSPWLAVLLLFVFVGAEAAGTFGEQPAKLARLILTYSALTWSGMAYFGHDNWLARADPFHRVFALFGAFAPFALTRPAPDTVALVARPPAAGLLRRHPQSLAEVVFVMLVLASVTFDGFSETPLWAGFLEWAAENRQLRGVLLGLSNAGFDLLAVFKIAGLACATGTLTAVYAAICGLAARAGGQIPVARAVKLFAKSLLPIAIAYHLSHYLSYLLLAGQLMIPIASDPFGLGWNLFATRNYALNIGIIAAADVWHVALVAIITGHILSVFVAHAQAVRLFPDAAAARRSQVPFIVLMTGFTMASLWILAQPVVEPAL